ncbi:btaf1 RNA polymerase II, B-TFIID transcription factor-associated, 170kDa [Boothiomyces sp. JEL0838]|nr:btaf1 RNA polymerase II, B-TFIID transcription factor-associated, 170kDa [Boothiomyces sp. JEL0838]
MTTRLDRLVLLLDTGSTSTVRSTAAKQIGQIQKQHPDELYPLLSRVLVHLNSKNWETRVAAGLAIQSICDNVSQWDPPSMEELEGLLSFDTIDINTVLEKGMPLVASAGSEFDADLSDMDPKQRLQIQKQRLKERLGFGTQLMDVDFFEEQDFTQQKGKKALTQKKAITEVVEVKVKKEEGDPFAGMSSRERNQLKRKMKQQAKKEGSNRYTDITSSSALKKRKVEEEKESDPNTTVVKFKEKPDMSSLGVFSTGDEWPFEGLCEQLSFDLFSPKWETRHGAAIGLRELIKTHGSGYGKIVGVEKAQNEKRHLMVLEDLLIRLLCVLSLDRFADFVGDQAVVPVRETCSQTLAVVLEHCPDDLCLKVINKGLLVMLEYHEKEKEENTQKWAVRHAALIGLKYWMAVRQDLLHQILLPLPNGQDSPAFKAIIEGLKDHNDDVRAVASSSLIPISDLLVKLLPEKKIFNTIVVYLWDSLQELDDLTAATSFVMDLLSDLLRKPQIIQILRKEASQFLEKLVPQLFPFFRHAITSVRLAVLRTLSSLAELSKEENSAGISWVTTDLLRLVFQNFVLEEKEEVIKSTSNVWSQLVELLAIKPCDQKILDNLCNSILSVLLAQVMSPIGTAFDSRLFISYRANPTAKSSDNSLNIPAQDRAMMNQDMTILAYDVVIHGRIAAAACLGKLACALMNHPKIVNLQPKVLEWIMAYVNSGWAFHRIVIGIVIQEWVISFNSIYKKSFLESNKLVQVIWDTMVQVLSDANAGAALYFVELQNQLQINRDDCMLLFNALKNHGNSLPPLPPMITKADPNFQSPLGTEFTLECSEMFLTSYIAPLMVNVSENMAELYRRAVSSKNASINLKRTLDTRVFSSLASAVSIMGSLPSKLNPIIRNLMNSIQNEENQELQKRSADGVAKMIELNILGQRTNINEKMIKNICVFLCSDPSIVGIAKEVRDENLVLTLKRLKELKPPPKGKTKGRKAAAVAQAVDQIDEAAVDAIKDAAQAEANEQDRIAKMILHRGAEAAIESLCAQFGPKLFESSPTFWTIISESLNTVNLLLLAKKKFTPEEPFTQPLCDSLHVIHILAKYIHPDLYPSMLTLMDPITSCLTCHLSLVRHLASNAIGSLARQIKVPAMIQVIEKVVPLTNHSTIDIDRQGSVEALYQIVDMLQDEVLPYLIFLMAPLLGRMSDSNEQVRFISTNVFAQLVKLAPLEAGVPNPPGFPQSLIEKKNIERKFIGQLIGTEKITEFELPVTVAAELRSYQKEGVSWLAFLNRYGLHGILCDDMGLGKTLQTICMIASDHYNRAEEYKKTKLVDFCHCPSLVVCPLPLTGHWFFEIKKYAEFLKPIIYTGDKNERAAIRRQMMSHDIIIISYEVLRNDIDHFAPLRFNYCCLDEGHVIRNPSTKLTKSVKSIKAFHRLILSGTPVQNNVVDLWSLFDFLMPGFLGTEVQFNERYGKPIQASRDAKASTKEQEKGALALEALHKQVLPFLMRRMKEDVLEDLPPKIIQDYYCELSDIQKMLYEDFSVMSEDIQNENGEGGKKGQHIFQALQYLRKLCNHPSLVLTPTHPQYEKVQAKLKAEKRTIHDIQNAPKLLALQQLLLDCGIGVERNETSEATAPHRVLIFAQVKQMLDMIQNDLFKKLMPTVTYMRLDGQITDPIKRHELVQTFNQDPSIDVLLLTTHVGGLGLNLTGADTVIFMEHDWNPQKDLQAMDRAHRIGQKRVVNVYRLITKGTLEEKIMGLQKFKLNLSSSIITSDNAGIASMDTNQIFDLFSLEGEEKPQKNANQKVSSKEAIEGLEQLWSEDQYDDLAVDDFLQDLKSRRK